MFGLTFTRREGWSLWRFLARKVKSAPYAGTCLFAGPERPGLVFFDAGLPVRDGDIVQWVVPSLPEHERHFTKWLLDVDGVQWLSDKTAAMRRSALHVPMGRVVGFLRANYEGSNDAAVSAELAAATRAYRANPPKRNDVVVFAEDVIEPEQMRAAIRAGLAVRRVRGIVRGMKKGRSWAAALLDLGQ